LLPTEADVPSSLDLDYEDDDLTLPEVAAEATDANAYLAKLTSWQYRGGASRQFAVDDPGVSDYLTKLLGLQVTVLEFGSTGAAREALAFQRDFALQQDGWDLDITGIDPLGDLTVALKGTADYEGTDVRAAVIFVQDGTRLYRFVGLSGATDHFDTVEDIARETVG
jgi:hypothetical protein